MRPRLRMFAYLLLAAAVAIAIDMSAKQTARHASWTLYRAQIRQCHASNRLRHLVNVHIDENRDTDRIVLRFILDARSARLTEWRTTHRRANLVAAGKYGKLAYVERRRDYVHIPDLNCAKTINKP